MKINEPEPRENEDHNSGGIGQPLDESLNSRDGSWSLKRTAELNKEKLETGMFRRFAVFTAILCAAAASSAPNSHAQKSGVKDIVLVHGAWADGSGRRGVYDDLVRDGFNVSIVQEPETSFNDDVTAVKRILALKVGPSILVAHSYGEPSLRKRARIYRLPDWYMLQRTCQTLEKRRRSGRWKALPE
jgi:hypothetical protein